MNEIKVTGIILSTGPIKDYDRRVVILTKEQGKIHAFANGARKPNSPLVGVTHPFSFGEFILFAGQSSYTIKSVKILNYFQEVRTDLENAYYGFYFLELTDYYTREANDERGMLKLLYQTLRALTHDKIPNPLIRPIFELKALTLNGMAPQVSKEEFPTLSQSTLYTMDYIISSKVESLYSFQVSDEVLAELTLVMKGLQQLHLDKKFNSLEMLEVFSLL